MSLSVRPAIQSDAASVAALSTEFATYLCSLGDPTDFQLSADTFLRDGFGPNPAFYGLVAEIDNCVIGYLLYHFGYDADLAARNLHMIDLYVTPNSRELGAARALLTQAQITGREAAPRQCCGRFLNPTSSLGVFMIILAPSSSTIWTTCR